ncbi:MAG: hypothetical protein LH629_01805 [Ignavibacteria bacterium]|nr:hypothetical protein [Ignavibacteria bacterium]
MKNIILIACICLIISSCKFSSPKVYVDNVEINPDSADLSLSYHQPNKSVFNTKSLIDSTVSGNEFLSCLVPDNWDLNYYSNWNKTDKKNPFKYFLQLTDTNQIESFTRYPTSSFFTTSNSINNADHSRVINKFELMDVKKISSTAVEAIKDFIIPLYKESIVSGYIIVDQKTLNTIVDRNVANNKKETGMVTIKYLLNEKEVEEIFFATIAKTIVTSDGYNSECNWQIENAVSFRTLAGQLEDELGVFQTIVYSIKDEPDWYYKYTMIKKMNNKNLQSNLSIPVLKSLFKTSTPDADIINDAEEIKNNNKKPTSVYISYKPSFNPFIDKTGNLVIFPNGYETAWKNKENIYVLSDDMKYNPNPKDNLDWVELKKNVSIMETCVIKGLGNRE